MLNKELLCPCSNASPLGVGVLSVDFYSDDANDVLYVEVVFQDGTQKTFEVHQLKSIRGNSPIVRFRLTATSGLFDDYVLSCRATPSVNSIFGVYNVSNVTVADKPFAYVSKMEMKVILDWQLPAQSQF